ncbi:MAG: hypothetical protein GY754_24545 [bacterium]|nr:hypothetical protein [bacterium]
MNTKYRFQRGQIVKNEELFVVLDEITSRLKNCNIEGKFLPEDDLSDYNICVEDIEILVTIK